ncbi:hypothetical protein LEN26_018282 [Aphanomyces euteiches]|nr:hypothetical protein LEN26_018282 [Aphanomyces euteiches]KAH9115004.1 hypothetical protein AeMF1_010923 [Aphanomyces euteiches]KAH9195879.1 hypothetical protein AeNC1_002147 [Aphanomyces euteiches]
MLRWFQTRRHHIKSTPSMSNWIEGKFDKSWSLYVDFDDTCSVRDTIADLAKLACKATNRPSTEWDRLVSLFLHDLSNVTKTLESTSSHSTFQPHVLDAFLEAYTAADAESVKRVEQSQVLQGIPKSSLISKVGLKPGCAELLSKWPGDVAIISSNWSQTFVTSALTDVAEKRAQHNLPFSVIANELELEDDVTTGNILMQIQSPRDKMAHVLRAQKSGRRVVFIGDGVNDLLALVAADVGLVLNSPGSSIFRLAKHVGLPILDSSTDGRGLIHIATWDAIRSFLDFQT